MPASIKQPCSYASLLTANPAINASAAQEAATAITAVLVYVLDWGRYADSTNAC